MNASTDWSVAGPAIITSFTGLLVVVLTYMTARTSKKVAAIDRAVNGQPATEPPMVDKVTDIHDEQARLRDAAAADVVVVAEIRAAEAAGPGYRSQPGPKPGRR